MRKVTMCLAASLITLAGANAFAQDVTSSRSNSGGAQIGVVGMLNYSSYAYSADDSDVADEFADHTESTLGFGGGLRAVVEFNPFLGIQPEILFKQYGATLKAEAGPFNIESTATTNYLQVPVLARLALPVGGSVTPKVLVGPTFGYFLSGSTKAGDDTKDIDAEDVERLDIGVAAGVGVDFATGPGALSLDLRYDRSLTQSNKASDMDGGLEVMNTGFSFLVGYNYKL